MIILGVRLKNIRSYKDQTIVFPPKGITTIYGDIGTGKTTLLNSISYALFGRQTMSGDPVEGYAYPKPDYLLRRGSSAGFVKLLLFHKNKFIVVCRYVEKRGDTYSDTGGYIRVYEYVNDKLTVKYSKQCGSKDLRAEVLRELDFKELVRKNEKPLVFTNTLYTPQFNINEVLTLNSNDRERLISYSFGLERYLNIKQNIKKIVDNIENILKNLRSKEEYILKQIGWKSPTDIEKELVKQMNELKQTRERLEREEKEVNEELTIVNNSLNTIREKKLEIQQAIGRLEAVKERLEKLILEHDREKKELEKLAEELNLTISGDIQTTRREIEERIETIIRDYENARRKLEEKNREEEEVLITRTNLEKKLRELKLRQGEYTGLLSNKKRELEKLEKELREITELVKKGICPTCRQRIVHEHGEKLINDKMKELESVRNEMISIDKELYEISAETADIEMKLSELGKKLDELNKEKSLLNETLNKLVEKRLKLENEVVNRISRITSFRNEIENLENIVKDLLDLRNNLNKLREEEIELENKRSNLEKKLKILLRELGRVESELKNLETRLESIRKVAEELEKVRSGIERYEKMKSFLDKVLLGIVNEVESCVRSVVLVKFRDLFRLFLNKLMEDHEIINADINNDFTVSIKVNVDGKLQDVLQPSGGQLTGVSLAYRLALNSTVRSLNPVLRDSVLLLDEPTTGFSPERVDKLRSLFRELSSSFGQVIIVTHDSKLLEIGDCKIKLSIDPSRTITSVKYEECIEEDIPFSDYRRFVEGLLSDKELALSDTSSEVVDYFESFFIKKK